MNCVNVPGEHNFAIVSRPTLHQLAWMQRTTLQSPRIFRGRGGQLLGNPMHVRSWHRTQADLHSDVQRDSSNHQPFPIIPFSLKTMSIKVQEPSRMGTQGTILIYSLRGLFSERRGTRSEFRFGMGVEWFYWPRPDSKFSFEPKFLCLWSNSFESFHSWKLTEVKVLLTWNKTTREYCHNADPAVPMRARPNGLSVGELMRCSRSRASIMLFPSRIKWQTMSIRTRRCEDMTSIIPTHPMG